MSVVLSAARGHPFARYIAVRLASGALVVWLAVTLVFVVFRALPGSNNLTILLGSSGRQLNQQQIAAARADLGLDQTLIVQYLRYLGDLAHGDLGTSYLMKRPVASLVLPPFVSTIQLTLAALAVAWVLSAGVIVVTAGRRGLIETPGRLVEIVAASLPQFWLGILLLVVFAIWLHWFPVVGGAGLHGIALPALALAIPIAGLLGQLTRQSFEDALEQPFVLSARARGFGDVRVRLRYALRHAVTPALTLTGQTIGWLIGGAVIVEQIFARPGVGVVVVRAVGARDLPTILGVIIVVAVGYVVVNVGVDVVARIIDPRSVTAR